MTSVASPPPYATIGLVLKTALAPSAPTLLALSSSVLPPGGGNATVPTASAPAEFTGAVSANKAGAMMAGAADLWLFAL